MKDNSSPLKHQFSPTLLLIIGLAGFAIILLGIKFSASLFNTFFLSFIITLTVSPIMEWFRRKGLGKTLSFLLTVLITLVVISLILFIVAFSIRQIVILVPTYEDELTGLQQSTSDQLDELGVDTSQVLSFDEDQTKKLAGTAINVLQGLSASISDTILFFIIFAFMLYGALGLADKAKRTKEDLENGMADRVDHYIKNIRKYVSVTAVVGLAMGFANTLFLLVIGVPFPVLWGILSFIMNFIPNIGFVIAVIPPALLALLTLGWVEAVIVVIGYILINGISGNIIQPKFVGEGVNLSPSVVFFSLVFWGFILGVLGAILAVPLTLAIKELILERDEDTRWIADLMEI